MKKLITILVVFFGLGGNSIVNAETEFTLDYDQMIGLDAEDLAETGLKEAYEKLKPMLKKYVENPAEVVEKIDNDLPSYSVSCSGVSYVIYTPDTQAEAWGKATYALFSIVNGQLKNSDVKFYAISGGNELGGMFLSQQQVSAAKKAYKKKTDWPYLPTLEHPWYGQYH